VSKCSVGQSLMFIYIHILSYYKLFHYFNLCLSVKLNSVSCWFTSVSCVTNWLSEFVFHAVRNWKNIYPSLRCILIFYVLVDVLRVVSSVWFSHSFNFQYLDVIFLDIYIIYPIIHPTSNWLANHKKNYLPLPV